MDFRKIKRAYTYLKNNGIKKSIDKLTLRRYTRKNMKNVSEKYEDYILNNEPSLKELEAQRKKVFKYEPKISFVIPMYNTKYEFFEELMESILNQTYSNFEVCLSDSSTDENQDILKYIGNKKDSRIIYKKIEKNGGISDNTNEAIKVATGEYIAFCDHDDVIELNALYEVVKAINDNDNVDFVYSDEDILENGKRKNPHFKPGFSPDLLTSYNYICHLCVVKKELLYKVGMLNKEYDGAQDYDFVLRATEQAKNIVHIPKILYHWRSHVSSTAGDSSSKMYVFEAAKKAIEAHFERLNIKVEVSILEEVGRYKVKYILDEEPKVSIIIPNKDNKSDLKKCIESVLKSTYKNYEVIVVENNSVKEDTFKYYELLEKEHKNIKVVYSKIKGFNYPKINNIGVENSTGEYIILLNNDTEVITTDWIENMIGICKRDDVGIVGAKLLYPDDTVQHAGVVIGIGGVAGHINLNIKENDPGYFSRANVINNFSAVTAACLMIKREIFDKVQGLDEKFAVAFNDIDLCLKVRKEDYLVVYTPYAKLHHFESKSRGAENTKEKKMRFAKEIDLFKDNWAEILEKGDPYYNKNLRLDKVNFSINTQKQER